MTHTPVSSASSSSPERPLAADELTRYFDQHRVPDKGRQLVQQVLHGDPVRRVGGGRRNVVVRYASRKMGRVIQAESRNVELVFLEQCEHDPNVLFFLCQPTFLSVRITDAKKRIRPIRTVPDYFVLHKEEGFYFVECKPYRDVAADHRGRWPVPDPSARTAVPAGLAGCASRARHPACLIRLLHSGA